MSSLTACKQWIRTHPLESIAAFAAVVGLVVLSLVGLSLLSDDSPGSSDASGRAGPGERFFEPLKVPQTSEDGRDGEIERRVDKARKAGLGLKGLAGEGGESHLQGHRISMQMSSSSPIRTVGYIVPTSLDNSYGVVKNVGSSWSLGTTVYGPPDYAQLFAQAGPAGNRITCTISVDGKVTERRSSVGPYGRLFCQG